MSCRRKQGTDELPTFPTLVAVRDLTYQQHREALPPLEMTSDYQMLSLMSWNPDAAVSSFDGALIVRFADYHDPSHGFYSFTGGANPDDIASTLLDAAADEPYCVPELRLVPEATASKLSGGFVVTEERNDFDYLYDVWDAVRMPGKQHRVSRSELARFERRHGAHCSVTALGPAEVDWVEIMELTEKWARNSTDPTATAELDAVLAFISLFHTRPFDTEVVTSLLRKDGELIGFDVTELMDGGWALNHFRHVSHDLLGAQTKLRRFVAELLQLRNIKVWNAEQDLGMEGLRSRKLKYRPVEFLRKYSISR